MEAAMSQGSQAHYDQDESSYSDSSDEQDIEGERVTKSCPQTEYRVTQSCPKVM